MVGTKFHLLPMLSSAYWMVKVLCDDILRRGETVKFTTGPSPLIQFCKRIFRVLIYHTCGVGHSIFECATPWALGVVFDWHTQRYEGSPLHSTNKTSTPKCLRARGRFRFGRPTTSSIDSDSDVSKLCEGPTPTYPR